MSNDLIIERTCVVEWCDRTKIYGYGYCARHYQQIKKVGGIKKTYNDLTSEELFWEHVHKTKDCWIWNGPILPTGYGSGWYGSREKGTYRAGPAHRLAYELTYGSVPDNLPLDHLCMNRRCVRPDHLEPVTQLVNSQRAAAARTHCRHGHPYTEDNLFRTTTQRGCRTCRRASQRRWADNNREQINQRKRNR